MTARDTIAATVHVAWCLEPNHEDCDGVDDSDERMANAVIRTVRGMAHDELAELRPDIATEFYILREQAAMRGQYLLTTLRAHQAAQAREDQP